MPKPPRRGGTHVAVHGRVRIATLALLGAAGVTWLVAAGADDPAPRARRALPSLLARDRPSVEPEPVEGVATDGPPPAEAEQREKVAEVEAHGTPPDAGDGRGSEWVVTGSLVDEAGHPVPTADLQSLYRVEVLGYWSTRGAGTTENGTFRFTFTQPPSAELFVIDAPGFVRRAVEATEEDLATLRSRGSLPDLRVVLRRSARVEGIVFLPDGTPARLAEVGWVDDPFERVAVPGLSTRADGEGRFVLDRLDPARGGYVIAVSRGRDMLSRAAPLSGRLGAGCVAWQDLRLEKLTRVTLALELVGTREGLQVWPDHRRRNAVAGTGLTSVETYSGQHAFELRDSSDDSWRQRVEFVIPHGIRQYTLRLEVWPPAPDR